MGSGKVVHSKEPSSAFHGKMVQKRQILCKTRNDYRSSVFSGLALDKLVSFVGYRDLPGIRLYNKSFAQ